VNRNRYKLLGLIAWQGGRWYLRRRARRTRLLVAAAVGGASALAGASAIARRSVRQRR